MMIVNETKTNVIVCGSASRGIVVKFNDKVLDVVDQYKYLGNLMNSVKRGNQDVFGETTNICAIKRDKQYMPCLND